jgi:hypothetical protein
MAASPDNYQISKGKFYVAPVVAPGDIETAVWTEVGNVSSATFTQELETLEHFSSMEGVRLKDKTVIIEKSATLVITTDEISAENIRMKVLGSAWSGGVSNIFATNSIERMVKFEPTNEVGPQYEWILYKVDFIPSGDFNLISDEWNNIELTGDVLAVSGAFGTLRDMAVLAMVGVSAVAFSVSGTLGTL